MLSVEIVQQMTAYNYAAHRRVWGHIMALTDDQFTTDIPYSHGSIRNHMVHLANVDRAWLGGLQELPDPRIHRRDPADFSTKESVHALCQTAADEVTQYVSTLDEAALKQQLEGLPMPTWQVLLHLVNHGTDHRAQVLRALHDLGASTLEQDVVYYVMQWQ
ncbi:MAG: DinB family protein [Anaerolineae bacterium]|nr:DinB family protein [Anaerolineae bacterium]